MNPPSRGARWEIQIHNTGREREREMTRRSEVKAKSVRKPLRDVANINGGGRSSRSVATATKKSTEKDKDSRNGAQQDEERVGDALDRLLLVHSDLSALSRQVLFCLVFGNRNRNWKRFLLRLIKLNLFSFTLLRECFGMFFVTSVK